MILFDDLFSSANSTKCQKLYVMELQHYLPHVPSQLKVSMYALGANEHVISCLKHKDDLYNYN